MRDRRLLWLLLPGLGVLELVLHLYFARRAPALEEWRALSGPAGELHRPGDLVVVAPRWAEPIARHALGDERFPVEMLARADASSFRRALEVSSLGARAEETRDWRVVEEREAGRFTLRVLENPAPVSPRYRFIEHVGPSDLSVAIVGSGGEVQCPYTDRARPSAGGLHGHVAFPRERFRCPGAEASFVGVTVIDDQNYLPRRCIWAHPPVEGALRLRFAGVPPGSSVRGWAGLSYFLFRDGVGEPVELSLVAGGKVLGSHRHRDEWGFRAFTIATPDRSGGGGGAVDVLVRAPASPSRHFCFVAEVL